MYCMDTQMESEECIPKVSLFSEKTDLENTW